MAASDFDKAGHSVVSIAIICMIPDTELRAVIESLNVRKASEIHLEQPYTSERYFAFSTAKDLRLRVAVVCCDGQSNIESALTTQNVLFRHNPRYLFLCGIGGGLKLSSCKMGDVVVDSEVVYRRYTKISEDGAFRPEVLNVPASAGGRRLAQRFFTDHPHPKAIQSSLNRGVLFAIHDEKILSWDYVLDHEATKAALLKDVDGKLAVVEMEGAGFFKAVDSYHRNYIQKPWLGNRAGAADALVVRGISDSAAGKAVTDAAVQNYREIAARNAAQTVFLLIDQLVEGDFS